MYSKTKQTRRQQKWSKGQKKANLEGVEHAQRVRAPPTCTQPIHGRWATGQGIQWVWSGGGEKERLYFGVTAQTFFGERCLARMTSRPKELSVG